MTQGLSRSLSRGSDVEGDMQQRMQRASWTEAVQVCERNTKQLRDRERGLIRSVKDLLGRGVALTREQSRWLFDISGRYGFRPASHVERSATKPDPFARLAANYAPARRPRVVFPGDETTVYVPDDLAVLAVGKELRFFRVTEVDATGKPTKSLPTKDVGHFAAEIEAYIVERAGESVPQASPGMHG